jgi:hypothetical protein
MPFPLPSIVKILKTTTDLVFRGDEIILLVVFLHENDDVGKYNNDDLEQML